MKHKSCGLAVSIAITLGSVLAAGSWSSAVAQEQDKEKPRQEQPTDKAKGDEQSPQGAEEVTLSGRVTGGENDVLTVTDEKQAEHKLTVTGETKVTKGGKEASAADLKMNSKVTVQARKGSDGAWTAVSIDIVSEGVTAEI
jgi:hypothetical protein